jgi:hypothetical protein
MALQIRRGTEAERTAGGGVVFAEGELIYVTDTDALYIGDGSTAGGVLLASDALADISAMLTANTIDDQLELEKDLILNGNDITGTGNIDITGNINATGNIVAGGNIDIGDAPGDTVTITAQVDSSITPETDTAYDLGTMSKRWRNVYANGATIDGQIDAVAINADVVADNSTVMVDVSANTLTGDLTGNVTGNLTGNVTGDVTGNVTGNTTGYHTGDVKGSVFGDDSTPIVDAVNNTLNGTLTGTVYGNIKATNGENVVVAGIDAATSTFGGIVTGSVLGNVTGDVTGNLTGNTTGYHTGDVKGSVFADGSTLLVDAVAGAIPGENITGSITATFTGDLTGNVTGDLTGDIITNNIDSADSSAITVVPPMIFNTSIVADQDFTLGGPNGVRITNEKIDAFSYISPSKLTINSICADENDYTQTIDITSNVKFANDVEIEGSIAAFGDRAISAQYRTQLGETGTLIGILRYDGDPYDDAELQDFNNYTIETQITNEVANFGVPVQFPVVADDSARSTLVPTPAKGMVILMEAGTAPAATNQLQYFNGSNWVNV